MIDKKYFQAEHIELALTLANTWLKLADELRKAGAEAEAQAIEEEISRWDYFKSKKGVRL